MEQPAPPVIALVRQGGKLENLKDSRFYEELCANAEGAQAEQANHGKFVAALKELNITTLQKETLKVLHSYGVRLPENETTINIIRCKQEMNDNKWKSLKATLWGSLKTDAPTGPIVDIIVDGLTVQFDGLKKPNSIQVLEERVPAVKKLNQLNPMASSGNAKQVGEKLTAALNVGGKGVTSTPQPVTDQDIGLNAEREDIKARNKAKGHTSDSPAVLAPKQRNMFEGELVSELDMRERM